MLCYVHSHTTHLLWTQRTQQAPNRSIEGLGIIWYILGVIEALLLFRLALKLLGANPQAGFSDLIYSLTYPLVVPFQAVFSTAQVGESTFEWTTALAMVVYWLLALAVLRVVVMSKSVSTSEAAVKLDRQV